MIQDNSKRKKKYKKKYKIPHIDYQSKTKEERLYIRLLKK